MKKISIISALALLALVYSCKKDNDSQEDKKDNDFQEEPKKKPAELIVGRWAWVSSKEYVIPVSGAPKDTTTRTFGPKDSLFFEANGRVITSILSTKYVDTNTYRFIADSTIVMWDDTVKISQITDNKLQFYTRDTIYGNAGGGRQTWDNLKR